MRDKNGILTYAAIAQQFDERLVDRMIRGGDKVASINCEGYSRRNFL